MEGGRREEGAVGDFKRYPVSATAASFIGLLCENPGSSCGDFHALNFNGGIMFPLFKKDFLFFNSL